MERTPTPAIRLMTVILGLLLFLGNTALAQPEPVDDAATRADAAVEAWLEQTPLSSDQLASIASLGAAELCRELPGLVTNQAPPAGTEVRLADRIERPTDDPDQRVFTYAAVRPGDQLDVVEVRLMRAADDWTVEYVGFRSSLELTGIRAWLQTPTAWLIFVAFTITVLMLLFRQESFLRRWLAAGRQAIREHRRLVIGTLVALYAIFGLGAWLGSTLPETCEQAIVDLVTSAVTTLGATDAYGSGNVPRAAVTTFYQNFVVVTASVTFSLAALLGVPAYLFAALSFFTQGIPFGLLGGGGVLELLFILVLLVLELTAYFLVVAGGGMLLVTIFRRGEGAVYRGYRKLLLMLPIAMLLLLVGAWYEALILIVG